uniref:FYVE-type domain-containing protein n=1 Tax=Heterorhabditis bacteriophora TaxID=37862 RepID=A0A1I7XIM7_HETBA
MSSTTACTNCRTKYSLFNREVGCSNCALSFCKRCLGYRAYLPKLADMPVSICFDCFQKIGAIVATDTVQIITTPLPQNSNNYKEYPTTDSKWWGTNPPPSMRNNVGCSFPHNRLPKMEEQANIKYINKNDAVSRNGQSIGRVLTLEEIEERLAALRGCDIEMVRNPRSWFYSTSNTPLTMDSADGLLRRTEDQIAIEESNDPIKYLEERYRQLHRDDEKNEDVKGAYKYSVYYHIKVQSCGTNPPVCGTTLSRDPAFSEVTEEEIIYIKRLIEDVNNRVKISDNDEKRMENDLKRVLDACE